MFRQNPPQTPMSVKNFGVGSIIYIDKSDNRKWLVIGLPNENRIGLLCLNTFTLIEGLYKQLNFPVKVEDNNYLTRDKVQKLIDLLNLNFTFSDFSFNEAGFKLGGNLK